MKARAHDAGRSTPPAQPTGGHRCPEGAEGRSGPHMDVSLAVPEHLVEAIAQRAAELVAERDVKPEAWIGVAEAAEHLACPRSRIYRLVSMRRIPHCKDGSRVLFRRSELDAWVAQGGARR